MNMFLHNIGEIDGGVSISPNDALVASSAMTYDYVLANPPFGKKSSMSFTNEEGEQETDDLTYNRQDFWATTSNKQLNFLQHIRTMLKNDRTGSRCRPGQCFYSKVEQEKLFGGNFWRIPTFIQSCVYRPVSFISLV